VQKRKPIWVFEEGYEKEVSWEGLGSMEKPDSKSIIWGRAERGSSRDQAITLGYVNGKEKVAAGGADALSGWANTLQNCQGGIVGRG